MRRLKIKFVSVSRSVKKENIDKNMVEKYLHAEDKNDSKRARFTQLACTFRFDLVAVVSILGNSSRKVKYDVVIELLNND